ncbi:MAG: hypothetical protein P4M14_12005 [Gammaproteobacteria bacterium]|nr:hypothetical protein [Gammaproteobacteria bacterium]
MLFKRTGIFSSFVLSASLLALPIAAHADLTIVNNTAENSTSIINDGICSAAPVFGEFGVTKAKSTNQVPQKTLNIACFFHPTNCKADIYMNPPPAPGQGDSCNGSPIATVVMNMNSGITSIKMSAGSPYKISANGFYLTIDPM